MNLHIARTLADTHLFSIPRLWYLRNAPYPPPDCSLFLAADWEAGVMDDDWMMMNVVATLETTCPWTGCYWTAARCWRSLSVPARGRCTAIQTWLLLGFAALRDWSSHPPLWLNSGSDCKIWNSFSTGGFSSYLIYK